jgi:hypothetical protein
VDREGSLIVPPFNVVPAIRFLQNQYGIYTNGISVFFDSGKIYVYDPMSADSSIKNRTLEIITKKASDVTDENMFSNIQIDDSTGNLRLYRKNDPSVGSVRDVFMDSIGQTTIVNSYDDDLKSVRREYDNDTDNGKVRYVWNPMQNDMFEKSMIHNSTKGTRIALANVDPGMFGPQTNVLITATIDGISGYYVITEESYSMSTSDFSTYSGSVMLSLAKIPD